MSASHYVSPVFCRSFSFNSKLNKQVCVIWFSKNAFQLTWLLCHLGETKFKPRKKRCTIVNVAIALFILAAGGLAVFLIVKLSRMFPIYIIYNINDIYTGANHDMVTAWNEIVINYIVIIVIYIMPCFIYVLYWL